MERKLHSIKDNRDNILSDAILSHDRQNANMQSVQDAMKHDLSPKARQLDERGDTRHSQLNQEYLINKGREILQESPTNKQKKNN